MRSVLTPIVMASVGRAVGAEPESAPDVSGDLAVSLAPTSQREVSRAVGRETARVLLRNDEPSKDGTTVIHPTSTVPDTAVVEVGDRVRRSKAFELLIFLLVQHRR